ncbi:hypothetical protein Natpe_1936 [Natrinema pellirubrum DSM 15624]|uniref:Uncharacterized protein n=1 Tax=Natrinema pellirubrum (strain DSM 15624 / CIP 106293 / JCM 10476 / NCIMB 786 / 157) TaxID=797303 RepID=L0JKL1_NATP1|nr:hypothetical protein Natpe_1936 [Natrinema pellirubrum DSM 15624]
MQPGVLNTVAVLAESVYDIIGVCEPFYDSFCSMPVPSILAVTDGIDAEYIVIGGQKRAPAGKALFWNTTQSVLLDADRPVVAVVSEGENRGTNSRRRRRTRRPSRGRVR